MLTAVFLFFNHQCSFPTGFDVLIDSCFHRFIHVSSQQQLLTQVPGPVLSPGSQCKRQARFWPARCLELIKEDKQMHDKAWCPQETREQYSGATHGDPDVLVLQLNVVKMTQNPSLIPGSHLLLTPLLPLQVCFPGQPNPLRMVIVRLNLSLDTHCLGDLRQISHLSESQFPSLLKCSD